MKSELHFIPISTLIKSNHFISLPSKSPKIVAGSDRGLIEEAEELQRHISGVIASLARRVEPSYLVLKKEFQGTDVGNADVKQTVHPVSSPVAREAG